MKGPKLYPLSNTSSTQSTKTKIRSKPKEPAKKADKLGLSTAGVGDKGDNMGQRKKQREKFDGSETSDFDAGDLIYKSKDLRLPTLEFGVN